MLYIVDQSSSATLRLSLVTSFEESLSTDVTAYPVDKGGNVVDNVYNKPVVFTLRGNIAGRDLLGAGGVYSDPSSAHNGQLKKGQLSFNSKGEVVNSSGAAPEATLPAVKEKLRAWRDAATLLSLMSVEAPNGAITAAITHKDLVLSSINFSESSSSGDAVDVSLTLTQIRLASLLTKRIKIPVVKVSDLAGGSGGESTVAVTQANKRDNANRTNSQPAPKKPQSILAFSVDYLAENFKASGALLK